MKELNNFRQFLKEGTWSVGSPKSINQAIKALEDLVNASPEEVLAAINDMGDMLYRVVGDDEFHDALDMAKEAAAAGDRYAGVKLSDAIARAEEISKSRGGQLNEDLRGLMAQGEKMVDFANKQSGYEGGVNTPVRGVLAVMAIAGAPDFDGDEELKAYYTRKLTKAIETQMGRQYMSGFSVNEDINEESVNENVIDMQWTSYVKSLVNDIRLNGVEQYKEFTEDDILEDFENYVAEKSGM